MDFIAAPYCACCGIPFQFTVADATLCGHCIQQAPSYDIARAVFVYDEVSGKLVHGFKFLDKTHMAPVFAQWMMRAAMQIMPHVDIIMPVPLHRKRLWNRKYNQSALLAACLSKVSGKRLLIEGLQRTRETMPQTGLKRDSRQKNVRGAFEVNPRYTQEVNGKSILLVDDVVTTGATVDACARRLKKAGASNVCVLSLARTVLS